MPRLKQRKAFSIIETVIVIIIMGIVLTPFSILVLNVLQQNVRSQAWATAVSLAEGEMERVASLRFSDQAASPGSGVNCEPLTAFSAPFSAYSHKVDVFYVNANSLNTSVGQPSNCPGSGTATDYKRVEITVTNSIAGNVKLISLVTNDW